MTSTTPILNPAHLRATAIAAEAAGFTAYDGGKEPDCLTQEDRARGYQCDECAERSEGRGGYE